MSDYCRFRLTRPDGLVLVVGRFHDPVPVTARERTVSADQAQAGILRRSPGYQLDCGPQSDWTPASGSTNRLRPQYDIDIFAADGNPVVRGYRMVKADRSVAR